jgi:hypothetical protein
VSSRRKPAACSIRAGQSRLADAGLTDQQQDPALALLGLTPAAAQQVEFFLASDQRG